MVANHTTTYELIQLLLNCHNLSEDPDHYALYEVCEGAGIDRLVRRDYHPVRIQEEWRKDVAYTWNFVLRRNITYLEMKSKVNHHICIIPAFYLHTGNISGRM